MILSVLVRLLKIHLLNDIDLPWFRTAFLKPTWESYLIWHSFGSTHFPGLQIPGQTATWKKKKYIYGRNNAGIWLAKQRKIQTKLGFNLVSTFKGLARIPETYKMENFAAMANIWKPFTIVVKPPMGLDRSDMIHFFYD